MSKLNLDAAELICVDWGSTNFRAFLLDADGDVLDSVSAEQGMLKLRKDEFEPFLLRNIDAWIKRQPLPVLMAGMVGSQQGWYEADYVVCPAELAGLCSKLSMVPNQRGLKIALIPGMSAAGISGQPDVMRGEEVQIFGMLSMLQSQGELDQHAVVCLPGTHTKWASVDHSNKGVLQVTNFSTQMTGEIHSVLLNHSILGRVRDSSCTSNEIDFDSFDQGVSCSQKAGGVLHQIFSARSRVLAKQLDAANVNSYLSGVLVGSEVEQMLNALADVTTVYLVGSDSLCELYQRAIRHYQVNVVTVNGNKSSYKGMLAIAQQANLLNQQPLLANA